MKFSFCTNHEFLSKLSVQEIPCQHLIPALNNAWAARHNTRLHGPLPPSFLGIAVWMTSQLNVALQRKLHRSLMCLAYFFNMLSMSVCRSRQWQTSSRLVQESNVCTVSVRGIPQWLGSLSCCVTTTQCVSLQHKVLFNFMFQEILFCCKLSHRVEQKTHTRIKYSQISEVGFYFQQKQ